MKIPILFQKRIPQKEFVERVRRKPMKPRHAAMLVLRMMLNLEEGATVTVDRNTFEEPPLDGWRRYRAGNEIRLHIHPPPAASTL